MPTQIYPPRAIVRQEVVGTSVPLQMPVQSVVLVGPNYQIKYRELASGTYTGSQINLEYPDLDTGAIVDTDNVDAYAYFTDPTGVIRTYAVAAASVTAGASYVTFGSGITVKYEVESGSRGRLSSVDYTPTYGKYYNLYTGATSDFVITVTGNVASDFVSGTTVVTPYIMVVDSTDDQTGYYKVTACEYTGGNTEITVEGDADFDGFESAGSVDFYPVQSSNLRETDSTFTSAAMNDELVFADGYYAGTYDVIEVTSDSSSAYCAYCAYVYQSVAQDTISGTTITVANGSLDDYIKVNDRVWVIDASGTNTTSFKVTRVRPDVITLDGSVSAVTDAYFVVGRYIQTSTSIEYQINHEATVGGTEVPDTQFLISYKALMTSSANSLIQVSSTQEAYSTLGLAVPENPLGLAAYLAVAEATYPIYCMRISTDDSTGYANAESALQGIDIPYYVVPLTQDSTVHTLFSNHATTMAGDDYQVERVVFINRALHTYTETTSGTTDGSFDAVSTDEFDVSSDITDDVAAGYTLYLTYDDSEGTATTSSQTVKSVSESGGVTTITLTAAFSGYAAFNADSSRTWAIRTPTLSKTGQASYIADYARGFANKRVVVVWPNTVLYSYIVNEAGDDPYEDASTTYTDEAVYGYYACAMLASLCASRSDPSRPMNRVQLSLLGGSSYTNGYFTAYDLNIMAGGGVLILAQRDEEGPLFVRDQLTTDTSSEEVIQLSSVTALDYGAAMLRGTIQPIVGIYKQDDDFNGKLRLHLNAAIQNLTANKIWEGAKVLSVTSSGSTVSVDISVDLYDVAKTVVITLKV